QVFANQGIEKRLREGRFLQVARLQGLEGFLGQQGSNQPETVGLGGGHETGRSPESIQVPRPSPAFSWGCPRQRKCTSFACPPGLPQRNYRALKAAGMSGPDFFEAPVFLVPTPRVGRRSRFPARSVGKVSAPLSPAIPPPEKKWTCICFRSGYDLGCGDSFKEEEGRSSGAVGKVRRACIPKVLALAGTSPVRRGHRRGFPGRGSSGQSWWPAALVWGIEPARGQAMNDLMETWRTAPRRPKAPVPCHAILVHIYPAGALMGSRYVLTDAALTIRRGPDCDIRIHDSSVSRHHVRIQLDVDGFYLVDLQSTNGTFVNDERESNCKLKDGDYLRVGNCIYRFLAGDNVEAAYHEEIYRRAIIDALTDIHNNRYLMEYLDRELARS